MLNILTLLFSSNKGCLHIILNAAINEDYKKKKIYQVLKGIYSMYTQPY